MSKPAAVAKLTATPGKREELITVLGELVDATAAEPGTEVYVLLRDTGDDDSVWFFELYSDKAALDAHSTSEAMKAIFPKLAGLVAGMPDIRAVEPVRAKGLDLG
jgi:quinol monooxygenase YgiN